MSGYFPDDDVKREIQSAPSRFKSSSVARLELNLPTSAKIKERQQKRRLIVLLASLNKANYSDDRDITELKWGAQKFVHNGTCHAGRDAEISKFCKEMQKKCREASGDPRLRGRLSDASRNFYLAGQGQAGKDPVEELIQHLEDQKKQTQKQWGEEQKRMQKRRLIVLLARISEADYSNDSNISHFKQIAQSFMGDPSRYIDKNGEYTAEFDAIISPFCDRICQKIKQRGALPDYVSNEALKAFYKAGQSENPEDAIEGLIKCLETQEKKAQEQHLIGLLANLKIEDYADNPRIRNFKERAQAFIDAEGRLIPGTEGNVRVLLREIHSESKEKSKIKYNSPAITAFYFAGRQPNFVEALIEDLREHQAFSEQENFLLSLLSCLEVEDYPKDSPIRAFRDKALLVRNLGSRQEFDSLKENIVSIHFMSSASSVSDNGIENHNAFFKAVKQTVGGNYAPLIACLQQHQMLPRELKVEPSPAEMFKSSSFSAAEGVDTPEGKREESKSEGDRSNSDEKDDEVIVEADAQLEDILSEEEAQRQQHKAQLINLLANLKIEDYENNRQIQIFKKRAKALVDEQGNLLPGTENDVYVLLKDISFISKKKSLFKDAPTTQFYKAGCEEDFVERLIEHLKMHQEQAFQLVQNWLALPGSLEEKDPNQTQQCADALLAQPEMKELKKEVEHLRSLTEEAYKLSIINSKTVDKVLHCLNVEVIESVHNMTRPADQIRQGPACNWDFLEVDTENISLDKKVVSRILMGIGIVVGVGLLVGLGLATGGVAPAVFAAVTAVVATVAPPITLPLAIGSIAAIVGGFGIYIRKSRHADIASEEGKFNRAKNLFRFQFQAEHRRVGEVKKEESQHGRVVDSSPMKMDLSRS